MGVTGIFAISGEHEQEDDDLDVLAVLCACVLLFGPDTGTLLMLCPQAMGPCSPHVCAKSACLKTLLLDLLNSVPPDADGH